MNKKIQFFAFFFLSSIVVFSQATLQVKVRDCRQTSSLLNIDEFKLYRSDSLLMTVRPIGQPKPILNLERGQYTLVYTGWFGKEVSTSVEIKKKKLYTVDLCLFTLDYEKEAYTPFIDSLRRREWYAILLYHHDSIFNFPKDTFPASDQFMLIARTLDDSYYARYKGIAKLLNKREIEMIRRFEMDLNYVNAKVCDVKDYYIINYRNTILRVTDESCAWRGFEYLKRGLKFKEK
jgi:hypothetical protein